MKISAKGRYGLAAMIFLARNYESGALVTILTISEKTGISKIYLEQVFALLKRARLVNSAKGAQGGYQLARAPRDISVYDLLSVIELSLIEKALPPTAGNMPDVDRVIDSVIYRPLDDNIREFLSNISLDDIIAAIDKDSANLTYYI